MKFNLTYGTEKVTFDVPESALPKDQPFIEPRKVKITPEMQNIEGSIKGALQKPVNSKRLKDLSTGKRVGLIVSDEFRAGQQEFIIKCMLEEIVLGSPKEVWIFCATGSHDPEIYTKHIEKWVHKYASALKLNYKFFGHDCMKDEHIFIGKTSDGNEVKILRQYLMCDVRAYGHESKHHYMNGYSCIDKQLLPGISARETIEGNHKNALNDRESFGGRNVWAPTKDRRKNPFSLGVFEARQLADSTFITDDGKIIKKELPQFGLDMISDKKAIYWIASGNISDISYQMTIEADKLAAFEVEPTKYVVISPGGPPASTALYGTQNCFDMALSGAIEDGGEALIIAPCEGRPDVPEDVRGLAPDPKAKILFYDNLVRLKAEPLEKAEKWIEENFELYLWKTDRVLKLLNRRKLKLYLYSMLSDEKVKNAGLLPVKNIQEWINERIKRKDSRIRVIDNGNKILVMSRQ